MQMPWRGRDGPGKDSLLPMAIIPTITGASAEADDEGRASRPSRHVRTTSAHARVRYPLYNSRYLLFADTMFRLWPMSFPT